MTAIFCVAVGRRIGEGTAKFYLDVAEGNLRDAIALYGKTGNLPLSARKPFESRVRDTCMSACRLLFGRAYHIALLFCCPYYMSKMYANWVWHCRARPGMGASTQGQAATISCM